MRELKFRVWDKHKSIMFYPSIIGVAPLENFAWEHSRSYLHNCQDWSGEDGFVYEPTLMQYTGLKDKNGVEIYEGDIVTVPYVDPLGRLHRDDVSYVGEVGFEFGRFVIKHQPKNYPLSDGCERVDGGYVSNYGTVELLQDKTIFEVIGNIHANLDLLK